MGNDAKSNQKYAGSLPDISEYQEYGSTTTQQNTSFTARGDGVAL